MHLSDKYKVRVTVPVTVQVVVERDIQLDPNHYEVDVESLELVLTDEGFQYVADSVVEDVRGAVGYDACCDETTLERWEAEFTITEGFNGNEVDVEDIRIGELES